MIAILISIARLWLFVPRFCLGILLLLIVLWFVETYIKPWQNLDNE